MVSDPPGTEERLSDVPPEGTLVPNPRAVVLAAAGNPAVCISLEVKECQILDFVFFFNILLVILSRYINFHIRFWYT